MCSFFLLLLSDKRGRLSHAAGTCRTWGIKGSSPGSTVKGYKKTVWYSHTEHHKETYPEGKPTSLCISGRRTQHYAQVSGRFPDLGPAPLRLPSCPVALWREKAFTVTCSSGIFTRVPFRYVPKGHRKLRTQNITVCVKNQGQSEKIKIFYLFLYKRGTAWQRYQRKRGARPGPSPKH